MQTCIVSFEKLPACVLSCYGSLQNQTPHFDAIAAVGKTYDLFFVSNTQQRLQTLVALTSKATTLLINAELFDFNPSVHQIVDPRLLQLTREEIEGHLANCSTPQFWIHVSQEACDPEDVMNALQAWELEIETLPTGKTVEETGLSLIEQGISNEQACRVVVSALTIAKDRLVGEIWEAWNARCQPNDQFIVSANHGDQRVALAGNPSWVSTLSDPLAHLPLIVHQTGKAHPVRDQTLLTSQQFFDFASFDASSKGKSNRQIRYESPQSIAHRTFDWLLIEKRLDENRLPTEGLFALHRKPEDIWEILNVADQFPDLIQVFQETGQL